jgi:D-alanyl-lipoteichoic acid acyltransferase DltB (MBOAT superfamily)
MRLRRALIALARRRAALARSLQLVHADGAAHPINGLLVSFRARVIVLCALLAGLLVLNRLGIARLLAWTDRVFPESHYPLLFAAFAAAYVALRGATGARRKRGLLVLSLFCAAYFHPLFALGSLGWVWLLHRVVFAAVPRAAKLAFLVTSYLALAVACDLVLFPDLGPAHPTLLLFGYMFAVNYTFRMFYFYHDASRREFAPVPLIDAMLYFLFAPFFIIVPYMAAIPRFDGFVAGLERSDSAVEASGIRHILAGAAFAVFLFCARGLYTPTLEGFGELCEQGRWLSALAAGLLLYPVGAFLNSVADAYILIGLIQVLGVNLAPAFHKPLGSTSLLEWWRRWNIHFRDFLVDLFFYPVLLRLRRRPYLALVAATAAVFLVGSVLFHLPKQHFRHNSLLRVQWPMLIESGILCMAVAALLCLEQRRKRQRVARPQPPRLDDVAVPLSAWLRFRLGLGSRVLATWLTLLVVVAGGNHALGWYLYERPRDVAQAAAIPALAEGRPLDTRERRLAEAALRHNPRDVALRLALATTVPPDEATRQRRIAERLASTAYLRQTLAWEASVTDDVRSTVETYILQLSGLDAVAHDRDLIATSVLPSIDLLDLVNFVADTWRVDISEGDVYSGRFATIDAIVKLVARRAAG